MAKAKKSKTSVKLQKKVDAYCFPCKKKGQIDDDFKLIQRELPNGRTVSILCGFCKACNAKVCKIIGNNKS
jgi:hypothetical protein